MDWAGVDHGESERVVVLSAWGIVGPVSTDLPLLETMLESSFAGETSFTRATSPRAVCVCDTRRTSHELQLQRFWEAGKETFAPFLCLAGTVFKGLYSCRRLTAVYFP